MPIGTANHVGSPRNLTANTGLGNDSVKNKNKLSSFNPNFNRAQNSFDFAVEDISNVL